MMLKPLQVILQSQIYFMLFKTVVENLFQDLLTLLMVVGEVNTIKGIEVVQVGVRNYEISTFNLISILEINSVFDS